MAWSRPARHAPLTQSFIPSPPEIHYDTVRNLMYQYQRCGLKDADIFAKLRGLGIGSKLALDYLELVVSTDL